jgi:hypothetical protein
VAAVRLPTAQNFHGDAINALLCSVGYNLRLSPKYLSSLRRALLSLLAGDNRLCAGSEQQKRILQGRLAGLRRQHEMQQRGEA